MASIFTGLAFMHGHIVDRELVLRLGRDEKALQRPVPATESRVVRSSGGAETKITLPDSACATC